MVSTFKSKSLNWCLKAGVEISHKSQGPFGPLVSKKWGPSFFLGPVWFFLYLLHIRYWKELTFSKDIWALGLNILRALTKFWGQLAQGPTLFWPLCKGEVACGQHPLTFWCHLMLLWCWRDHLWLRDKIACCQSLASGSLCPYRGCAYDVDYCNPKLCSVK